MLVFNKDFIEENFSSYDNLKGVFTIGEENIQVQGLIDDLKEEQDEFKYK
ncbi:AAA family ATPase [uncultured Granulicatella sp.]